MRPKELRDSGQSDLEHPLVKLGSSIDWGFLARKFGAADADAPSHPPLPARLVVGLAILKAMHHLPDKALCDRWIENTYFQLVCGEKFFRHAAVRPLLDNPAGGSGWRKTS